MVFIYPDIIINSMSSPPGIPSATVLDVDGVLEELVPQVELVVGTARREVSMAPRARNFVAAGHIDTQFNAALFRHPKLNCFKLNLSLSSFKCNDPYHQTQKSKKATIAKVMRFFGLSKALKHYKQMSDSDN